MDENCVNGVRLGTVHCLKDPDGLGKVQVKFHNDVLSDWLRVASPMAGANRGFFMRPEIDDEVLVIYEYGNTNGSAYVLGTVWSETDPPPKDDGGAEKNNWRFIRSRSGHIIKLDDSDGSELIEVIHKDGKRRIILDGSSIQIICDSGDIAVKAPEGNLTVEAKQVSVKATTDMTLEATGKMTIKGATVDINP